MADKIVARRGNHAVVQLDERRLYAKRPHGRGEYYVGPGQVTVPRKVAESWGLVWGDDPPWDGYDDLTAEQVITRAQGIPDAERKAVIAYERAGKGRKTVLEGLGDTKAQSAGGTPTSGTAASATGTAGGAASGASGGSSGGGAGAAG